MDPQQADSAFRNPHSGGPSSSLSSPTATAPGSSTPKSPPPSASGSFQFNPNAQVKVNPLYAMSQHSDRVYHIVSAGHGKTKIIEGDPAESASTRDNLHRVWTSLSHMESKTESARRRRGISDEKEDSPARTANSSPANSRPTTPTSPPSFLDRFNHHRKRRSSRPKTPPALRAPSLPPTPPISEAEQYDTADEADNITIGSGHPRETTRETSGSADFFYTAEPEVAAPLAATTALSLTIQPPITAVESATTLVDTPVITSLQNIPLERSSPVAFLAPPPLRSTTKERDASNRPGSPASQVSFSPSVSSSPKLGSSSRPGVQRSQSTQALKLNLDFAKVPPNAVASSSKSGLSQTASFSERGRAKSPSRQLSYPAPDSVQADTSGDLDLDIAKQAEEIRRERLSRRLEKEKAEQAQAIHDTFRRERSTSKGQREGEDNLRGWNQPIPHPGLLQRAGTLIEDKPMIGNLIGEDHVNYVLMYNMLTGIRIGVSRCQAKPKRPLTDEDYSAQHKFSFDIIGNELTPSARYDFKFKDYAPWVFRDLREHFMLDPADYLLSLTAKYILSEMGSPGKSGSFFYFSRDYRFIIKTIHHAEHKFLRKVLKPYHDHVKSNPHTLISRFYGLHRVKLPRGRKIHFVIMNNLMPPHRDVHETYDLKGSTVKREYPEDKAAANPNATLKDLNWIHRNKRMQLGPEKRALFTEQLKEDSAFLKKLGVMDYSLLIGFHDMARGNTEKLREGALSMFNPETSPKLRRRHTQREREQDPSAVRMAVERSDPKAIADINWLPDQDRSERRHFIFYQDEGGLQATNDHDEPLPTIYYLGIIDILTPWGVKKIFENFFKGLANDRHAISPVPPIEYGNRFQAFITDVTKTEAEMSEKRGRRSRRISASKALAESPQKEKAMSEKVKLS